MSNLSGLRTTLKKWSSNATQFLRPAVLRNTVITETNGTTASDSESRRSIPAPHSQADVTMTDNPVDVISSLVDVRPSAFKTTAESSLAPANAPSVTDQRWTPDTTQSGADAVSSEYSTGSITTPRLTSTGRLEAETSAALSDEQRAVANAPADERQLVIAGPGTGKTFTVVRRLEYLLGEGGLDVNQILVLSFSRSAVREIRTRLRARVRNDNAHGDLEYLEVRTFDSFAFQMLTAIGEKPSLSADSWDQNIKSAAKAVLESESEARGIIAGIRHLIVDELQDLVGPRASLVQNILSVTEAGFTLLGDPAQAIYDYQVYKQRRGHRRRKAQGITATEFLQWIREHRTRWKLRERTLRKNRRGSVECFEVSERYRAAILREESAHQVLEPFKADLNRLPDVGTASAIDPSLHHLPDGKTAAILCRNNNEALQVHRLLLEQSIPHTMAVDKEDVGLPAWVGRAFSVWTQPDLTRPQFNQLWSERIGTRAGVQPDNAWKSLLHAMEKPSGTKRIRMEELRSALARRPELPGDIAEINAPITISTIHRAKGREFDYVMILQDERATPRIQSHTEAAEEARVLYVAATRARERLNGLRRGNLGALKTLYGNSERSYVHLPDRKVLVQMGVRGDVDDRAGIGNAPMLMPGAAQNYLWDFALRPSQGYVNLVRERPNDRFSIRSIDTGLVLGFTSTNFASDMNTLGQMIEEQITRIVRVPVRAIETVVLGANRDEVQDPYSQSGFCLAVRVQGAVYVGMWRQ